MEPNANVIFERILPAAVWRRGLRGNVGLWYYSGKNLQKLGDE